MHFLAQELNKALEDSVAGALLSDLGKRIYFPKGIIAQGAEAKQLGKRANATIGMAIAGGKPVVLEEIASQMPHLSAEEFVGYAPTAGILELRELWKTLLVKKNPRLHGRLFSLPVVTGGVTAALSCLFSLFLGKGQGLITAVPSWDNYPLAAEALCEGHIVPFDMFCGDGFNLDGFEKTLAEEAKKGTARVLLNFPHNPSGYSPTTDEARRLCAVIKKTAESGCKCLVICDDAYFGLAYEPDVEKQSLFAYLADIHENVLAIKTDGATKEDFVWGFRCGFITMAGKSLTDRHHEALERKLMGVIRATYSCSPTPSQTILLKAYQKDTLESSKKTFADMLRSRYQKVRAIVDANKGHSVLTALPFNSGYFMSFRCSGVNAEDLRIKLLKEEEIGAIAITEDILRIAFSSIDEDDIDFVYKTVYGVAEDVGKS
jgi:aspartate/methionine/tyrosine aminotransferase